MRAVVVGAGLAGLSAALRLRERGFEVVIVERSRLVGGKATSFTVDGIEVDNGQHVHLACCDEYLDFVASVGMRDVLWTQDSFDVTVLARGARPTRLRATRGLPASLALLPSVAMYRALRPIAKLRLATAMRAIGRPVHPDETFAAWLRRHHQDARAIAGFWAPFVVPAVNATLDEVSAADALFVVRTAFGNPANARIGWSRVPLARIAEAAAEKAGTVRLRAAVTALVEEDDHVVGVRCSTGEVIEGDVVVAAVPPARLRAILGDPDRFGVAGLDAFESRAIVDVHLWFDVDSVGLQFAAILDSPVQWVFEKSAGRLCCSMSAADSLVGQPETDIVELSRREVVAAWPRLASARLVRGAVTRDGDATFIPRPGLRRPGWRTTRPNLAIAGAWTDTGWPATMESAVRSGRAAGRGVKVATASTTRDLAGAAHG